MAFVKAQRLKFGVAATALCITATMASSLPAHAALSEAARIVKSTQDIYSNLRTFSANITAERSGKVPQGSFTETISEETYYKAPNLFSQHVHISGTGLAAKVHSEVITTSNGSTIIAYDPIHRMYTKNPAPKKASPIAVLQMKFNLATARIIGSTSLFGRPAYQVKVEAMLLPSVAQLPKQRQEEIHKQALVVLTIDKSTHKLLRLFSASAGLTETIKDQVVNGAISPAHFRFTIPAGAKEFHPAAAPGMPGK